MMMSRLAIPSIGIRGVISIRFRCLQGHDCKEAECKKYMGIPGVETRPFNTRALHTSGSRIGISEGELDAISLELSGLPAIGIPSAMAWKPHYPRLFDGFEEVYVFGDGDSAGTDFSSHVVRDVPHAIVVTMGQGQDVNDVLVKEGPEGVRKLIAQADPARAA